jgi:hypothetical protein
MITKETKETVEKLKNYLDKQSRTSDGNLNKFSNQIDEKKLRDKIDSLIKEYDIIIDIHSSPTIIKPFVLVDIDKYSGSLTEMLTDCNISFVTRYSTQATIKSKSLESSSIEKQKLGLTIETGFMNWYEKRENNTIFLIEKLLDNAVYLINNLHTKSINDSHKLIELYTPIEGLITMSDVKTIINEGEILFTVSDLLGNLLYEQVAKQKTYVIEFPHKLLYKSGESIGSYYLD